MAAVYLFRSGEGEMSAHQAWPCVRILFNQRTPHCGFNLDALQGALIKRAVLNCTDRSLKRRSVAGLLETPDHTYIN